MGSDTAFDNTTMEVAGYFYNTTTKSMDPCPIGCKACTDKDTCSDCAAPFKLDDKKECKCPTDDGAWGDDAKCTANDVTDCKKQLKAGVCETCNDKKVKEPATDATKCVDPPADDKPKTTDPETPPKAADPNVDDTPNKEKTGCDVSMIGCT